jgi:DNA-binding winged helix-turn-helix (wHTH) protein
VPTGAVHTFGPFQFDVGARRLTRDGVTLKVPARHLDVLAALLAKAGIVIAKDALVVAAWADVAVTDNSLEQAVSALRKLLGRRSGAEPYIQTIPRQGYRFAGDVHTQAARETDIELAALVAPHRAWVEGRAALESLAAPRVAEARAAFERLLQGAPHDTSGHLGLANACAMQFELTRADLVPDVAALTVASQHVQEACRLDPGSGEAWATRAFVLDRMGQGQEARASAARAVSLEPDNWRHHFRLALVSWGEARLRAARRTQTLLPGMPLAHWLAATVHVARQAFDEAERELAAGIDSMRATHDDGGAKFPGVALDWLAGLIRLLRGDEAGALEHFERELAGAHHEHLYTREACASTWYAIGAVHLRHGRRQEAAGAFRRAVDRVARHPAAAALGALEAGTARGRSRKAASRVGRIDERSDTETRTAVDLALAGAVHSMIAGTGPLEAATGVAQALAKAETGNHVWWLPVEPVLRVADHPAAWATVLAQLRARAA